MNLQRFTIDGFGQIEPNNVTFTRDGRVEAQCALASEDFVAENGMLLAVDVANMTVKAPDASETLPIALHYSTEKNYNQFTPGLKNFRLTKKDGYYPRMGYLTIGEVFTTNCLCYDTSVFPNDAALKTAVAAAGTTALYGGISTLGAIKIGETKPTVGPVLKVAKATTMPDGQYAVEFQVQ